MRINNNVMALNAHRQLGANQAAGAKSMERLSSGLRINRAGDDAAGLAISEKMRGQIRGLKQATRNAQDGISMIQTAEGNLNETHSILQRMRELANQAANDTNVGVDRSEIQKEINQLTSEINRIGNNTEFNTQKLLNGSKELSGGTGGVQLQIGANATQSFTIDIFDMRAAALGIAGATGGSAVLTAGSTTNGVAISAEDANASTGAKFAATDQLTDDSGTAEYALDVSDHASATAAVQVLDKAVEQVSAERSKLGAFQNRLEHTISNLGTSAENLQAAESRIRDLDMAEEIMAFTKSNILNQAATAMLAQANMAPQSVLQLLG